MKTAAACMLAALLLSAGAAFSAEPRAGEAVTEVSAITKPSQDVVLSFTHPGRVADILVKEGEAVKQGQLLAREDDSEEQAALDVAEAQANDDTRSEAQVTVRDQKKKVYENKRDSPAAGQSERDEALLDWKVAEANVRLSNFEHAQDARKALQAKATLEKTRIKSPIAGVVEQTLVKAGENVDSQNMKVVRVVQIDPLWIEAPVPFAVARNLKDDAPVAVKFSDGSERTGKVIHVATVADAASDTLLVRVEVANPSHAPAGERVAVTLNGPKGVAAN